MKVMQNSNNTPCHPILGDFQPIEDLLYHDCPYVFTFRDAQAALALAYLVDMEKQSTRYIAVPIGEKDLDNLKNHSLPLRKVFRDWVWDVRLDQNADIVAVRQVPIQEISPADLPPVDLFL